MYAKVAEKKKQLVVTREMSIAVVMKLFRASLHLVAGLRGFFPEIYHEETNLEGVSYSGLKKNSGNEQVQRYMDWIEKGIRDALNKGYLKTCHLEVYETKNEEIVKLLEVYKFTVRYSEEGAEFIVSQGTKSDQSNPINIKESIKESLRKMLLCLWDMTVKLKPLPNSRRMKMRLFYNDSTPEGYQPPMFREATDSDRAGFDTSAVHIDLEGLSTPHHTINLSMLVDKTSIRSNDCPEGNGETDVDPGDKSQQGKTLAHSDDDDSDGNDSDDAIEQNQTQKSAKQPSKRKVAPATGHVQDTAKKRGAKKMKLVDNIAEEDGITSSESESESDPEYVPGPKTKTNSCTQLQRRRRGGNRSKGRHVRKGKPAPTRPKNNAKKSLSIRGTHPEPVKTSGDIEPRTNARKGITGKDVDCKDQK